MPGYDRGRLATPEEQEKLRQAILAQISSLDPMAVHAKGVGQLDPRVAAVDCITFEADYSASGVISGKTVPKKTPGGYFAELYAISGYMQKPGTNPEVLPGIKANIKDQEYTGSFFTTDLVFASFVSASDGFGRIDIPRGLYLFKPASGIEVTWDADTTIYTSASAKKCGLMLHFNLWTVG